MFLFKLFSGTIMCFFNLQCDRIISYLFRKALESLPIRQRLNYLLKGQVMIYFVNLLYFIEAIPSKAKG